MDPITHVTAGILIGQAVRDRFPVARGFVPLAAFAAWMPDLDNIVTFFGPEAYMLYHRGYTHSILGGAVMAWLLAWIMARFWPDAGRRRLFVLYFVCVLSHLFLDTITSYGTMLFLPFSDVRVAVSSVYIVDPVFTLTLIALAVLSLRRPAARKTLAVAGLAVMLAWPALGFGIGRLTDAQAERLLAARGIQAGEVHVQPDAFAPLWWKVIARDGDQYVLTGLNWLHPDRLLPERRYARADAGELKRLGAQAPVFSYYLWFTDFPVRMVEDTPDGARETFADLRFMAVNPVVEAIRGPAIPFTLAADLSPSGHLIRAFFSQMGKATEILPAGGLR
jgi:inner membrane protein